MSYHRGFLRNYLGGRRLIGGGLAVAVVALSMVLSTGGPADAKQEGREVVIRLRGTTGTERVTIQSGFVKYGSWSSVSDYGEWTLTSEFMEIRIDQTDPHGWYRVNFINDGYDATSGDRNVIVDWLETDGVRVQADAPDIRSKGVWNGSDCGEGFRRSNFMACNGWFEILAGDRRNPDRPYEIEVVAQGTTGSELLGYEVDGSLQHTWELTTSLDRYTFEQPIYTGGDNVRLVFLNDGYEPVAGDRNIKVSEISFDDRSYRPEDLRSKGSWNGVDCGEGFRNSQWLHCTGWFEIVGDGSQERPSMVAVSITSRGTTGDEALTVQLNGNTHTTLQLTRSLSTRSFSLSRDGFLGADPRDARNVVRFLFDNDGTVPSLGDKNVFIDSIVYDGVSLDARDLLTKGSWNGSDCAEGFRNSNWLHCNGWIEVWPQ